MPSQKKQARRPTGDPNAARGKDADREALMIGNVKPDHDSRNPGRRKTQSWDY
jgi:hypothetical protein